MSYEQEIMDILDVKGEVIGFNEFCNMRINKEKFNPSPFSKAIKKLKNKGQIDTEKLKDGRTRYFPLKPKLEQAWKKLTHELDRIETSLSNPELTIDEKLFLRTNWVRKAIYQYNTLLFYLLFADLYKIKSEKIQYFTKLQKRLFDKIDAKIHELGLNEKYSILTHSFPKEPELLSLNEYRQITYEPTAKELKENKKKELEELEQSHNKSPYCIFCGKKTMSYKESQKHEDKHMNNFEKNPVETLRNFNGLYCTECGKKIGTKKDLTNHRCSLKN